MSESESERVGGEAAGGGGRGGADTELKTKTPHVNVGKNRLQPVVPQVVNFDPQTFIPLAKGAARLRRRLHRTTRGQIRPVASSHWDLGLGLHRGLSPVMS